MLCQPFQFLPTHVIDVPFYWTFSWFTVNLNHLYHTLGAKLQIPIEGILQGKWAWPPTEGHCEEGFVAPEQALYSLVPSLLSTDVLHDMRETISSVAQLIHPSPLLLIS